MRAYSADLRALFCRYLDEGMSSRAAGRVVGSVIGRYMQRHRHQEFIRFGPAHPRGTTWKGAGGWATRLVAHIAG
ncbi:hypothetical protein NUH86_00660 [Sphingobium sp. JS3065]|uniref:hypothetical protein n=1 Tax=Sphingobium sp. JS3065 TaxID=2970925 RepID=UPI0022645335|nr:hypothetical protein [Sphingobium sp. JS3065]UZW55356.1 hypothetical protein NUH86_00660 [Sphingobium sp. JS3065]